MTDENRRHITLIRHAKSSWNHPGLSDFERPLNERGRGDAPRVGRYLAENNVHFDKVLCSSAARARETLDGLSESLEIRDQDIDRREDLYLASAETIKSIIAEQQADRKDIAIIAHNPGIENLAWELSGRTVDRMPTCCVVRLLFGDHEDDWSRILRNAADLELYLLAREIR